MKGMKVDSRTILFQGINNVEICLVKMNVSWVHSLITRPDMAKFVCKEIGTVSEVI